ncbi:YsnF/AvaK domain-containing protein [Arthrobacter sp. MDT2-2]
MSQPKKADPNFIPPNCSFSAATTSLRRLFGTKQSFVPLEDATADGKDLRVPYSKDLVKDAPSVERDGHLSPEEEERLYRHYNLSSGGTGTTTGTGTGTGLTGEGREAPGFQRGDEQVDCTNLHGTVGHDTSGPTTHEAMTRSKEELRVGAETRETGRARLRKHVVTENVSETVPLRHEEVRVEREPITDANRDAATSGPAISEEEHEVVLTEERPVVEKEAVPVERVRLDKETVTEQQPVEGQVREERIEVEGDNTHR